MFRRLAELEGFQGSAAAASTNPLIAYMQQQSNFYNNQAPNLIPIADNVPVPPTIGDAMKGINTATREPVSAFPNAASIFLPVGDKAGEEARKCKEATLDDLIATRAADAEVGCGWAYAPPADTLNPLPRVSQGALGTRGGAFSGLAPPTATRWFWDLKEAKNQVMKDRCSALRSCSSLGSADFAGCEYCLDTNRGIVAGAACSNRVSSAAACPPPAAQPQTAGPAPVRDICTPDSNGRLSADCMKRQLDAAGCKPNGTLYLALSNAVPGNYIRDLSGSTSVALYKKYTQTPLNETILRDGRATVAAVFTEFNNIAAAATTKPATSALGAAARDLCLQRGAIDAFDFCSEIADTTPGPFSLDCTQKLFIKLGGQPAGSLYPTLQTMQDFYNKFATWGEIRTALTTRFNAIRGPATNLAKQAVILKELYGIAFDLGWRNFPATMRNIQITTGSRLVGVDTANNFWYYQTEGGWRKLPGQGKQIYIGSDGTILCTDNTDSPFIYNWRDNNWTKIGGPGVKFAAINGSNVWGYNSAGDMYYWNGLGWNQIAGRVSLDMAAGGDGTVIHIGYPVENNAGGGVMYMWSGAGWNAMPGRAVSVYVGDMKNIWCINNGNDIWQWSFSRRDWEWRSNSSSGIRRLAVGPGGDLVLGADTNNKWYMWVGGKWMEVSAV